MHKILTFLALFCACAVSIVTGQQPQQPCLCSTPGSSGSWGSWGSCIANTARGEICDNAQRTRRCFRGQIPVNCYSTETCANVQSCLGAWTTWSPIGPCNTRCGIGIQPSARNCYKKFTQPPFRSKSCAGAFGVNEQLRNETCSNSIGCSDFTPRTPDPTRIRTWPSTTSTLPVTSSRTTAVTQSSSEPNVTPTNGGGPVSSTTTTPKPTSSTDAAGRTAGQGGGQSLDVTLLAAILGSVLLLCIAIVVIAIVVTRRRRRHSGGGQSRRLPTSADQVFHRESGNYEEAGPPLPNRNNGNDDMVENSLYETIDLKKIGAPVEEDYDSGYQAAGDMSMNGNGYLQPFNAVIPSVPDAYLSLDRNNRTNN